MVEGLSGGGFLNSVRPEPKISGARAQALAALKNEIGNNSETIYGSLKRLYNWLKQKEDPGRIPEMGMGAPKAVVPQNNDQVARKEAAKAEEPSKVKDGQGKVKSDDEAPDLSVPVSLLNPDQGKNVYGVV